MKDVVISDAVKYIGVDDKTIDLFESQYVVPNGISYNSYVIVDEQIAVMDTVDKRATQEWLKNLEEVDVNYGMLCCALKYGKKDAAYLQYEIMKSYFKRVQKNLPPEEQNDEKVQHTVDEIHRAKKELMEAGADTLRNKLEAAVWFANARVYYRLKGWT